MCRHHRTIVTDIKTDAQFVVVSEQILLVIGRLDPLIDDTLSNAVGIVLAERGIVLGGDVLRPAATDDATVIESIARAIAVRREVPEVIAIVQILTVVTSHGG